MQNFLYFFLLFGMVDHMLCYLVFCRKDSALMRRSLEWMKKLGGCKNHDAVLTYEAGLNADEHLVLAKEVFNRVDINPVPITTRDWIEAANQMFRSCAYNAHLLKKQDWFMMEADCVPLKRGWLDVIESEYKAKGKPFMLTSMGTPPHRSLCGNACYSKDTPIIDFRLVKEYKPNDKGQYQAWDGIFRLINPNLISYTDTIWHDFGNSPGNWNDGKPLTFKSVDDLKHIMASPAVVLHRCKDGSVIDVLAGTDNRPKTALHGGDLGDAIYGLSVILKLGVSELYFSEKYPGREVMTQDRVDLLKPLFIHAGLKKVDMHRGEWIDYDFTDFRSLYKYRNGDHSLLGTQAKFIGQAVDVTWPWIKLNEPRTDKVVVARSPRYHNSKFPWKQVVDKFKDKILFMGLPHEYDDFCAKFGVVEYKPVGDFLQAAKIISSSKLLIANQSSIYALGEALKHPRILECSPSETNRDCCLGGGEVQYVVDGTVDLTRFETKEPKLTKKEKVKLTKSEVKEVEKFVKDHPIESTEDEIIKDHRAGFTWTQLVSKHRKVGLKNLSRIIKSSKEVVNA